MSRDYKNLAPGHYYHLYNRGNRHQNIFVDDQDYLNFVKRLIFILDIQNGPGNFDRGNLRLTSVPRGSFSVLAYCLMPNHFHLLIKQNTDLKISVLMNRMLTSYVKYFNRKYSYVGSLFQDTYKAKLVFNDLYLAYVSAYIHSNRTEYNYPYSSLGQYLFNEKGLCDTREIMSLFAFKSEKYQMYLKNVVTKGDLRQRSPLKL